MEHAKRVFGSDGNETEYDPITAKLGDPTHPLYFNRNQDNNLQDSKKKWRRVDSKQLIGRSDVNLTCRKVSRQD